MAIGLYIHPGSMTLDQYDEAMRKLADAGAANPTGRQFHSCFMEGDKLAIFDIWETEADFAAFGEVLGPILKEIGAETGEPSVIPIHNVLYG